MATEFRVFGVLPGPEVPKQWVSAERATRGLRLRWKIKHNLGRGRGHKNNNEQNRGVAGQQPSSNRKYGTESMKNRQIPMRQTDHFSRSDKKQTKYELGYCQPEGEEGVSQ